jgi:hypothetical protein
VVIRSSIIWDTTPCCPSKTNGNFEGTNCLHVQIGRKSQGRSQRKADRKLKCKLPTSCWIPAWLFLLDQRCRRHFCPKCPVAINGFHSFESQKIKTLLEWINLVRDRFHHHMSESVMNNASVTGMQTFEVERELPSFNVESWNITRQTN